MADLGHSLSSLTEADFVEWCNAQRQAPRQNFSEATTATAGRWVTIGGHPDGTHDHAGGTPVLLDRRTGRIIGGGPREWRGKLLDETSHSGLKRAAERTQRIHDHADLLARITPRERKPRPKRDGPTDAEIMEARRRIKAGSLDRIAEQMERVRERGRAKWLKQNLSEGMFESVDFSAGIFHDFIDAADYTRPAKEKLQARLRTANQEEGPRIVFNAAIRQARKGRPLSKILGELYTAATGKIFHDQSEFDADKVMELENRAQQLNYTAEQQTRRERRAAELADEVPFREFPPIGWFRRRQWVERYCRLSGDEIF